MNFKQQLLLVCISLFCLCKVYAQTEIEGIINADSTLSLSQSPYLIVDDLVVAPDGQLTIEPGVELRFSQGTKLEIRGILNALGSESEKIIFTSESNNVSGSWIGIDIKNTQAIDIRIEHCNIFYAATAINEECCWGAQVSIKNCRFINNDTALGGFSGDETRIEDCYFSDNMICVANADKRLDNCIFENNTYGLLNTERVSVFNSRFTNHSEVAVSGGRGLLVNTNIKDNNIGVSTFFEGFDTRDCIISDNRIGIEFQASNNEYLPVVNSQICSNLDYNIVNNSTSNIELYSNCWCESNQNLIEEKLFDGDDDGNLGFISYDIFSQDCMEVVATVDKTLPRTNRWTLENSPYIINENYIVKTNDTLYIDPGVEVRFASPASLEVRGNLIAVGEDGNNILFTALNTTIGWQGVRIMHSQGANAHFEYCTFEYANEAINEECCWGGEVSITNCRFLNNSLCIGGFSGDKTQITGCYFANNSACIGAADKRVDDCVFENNDFGLYNTERVDVYNSMFNNHAEVALLGGRGELVNTTVINNNIGIQSFFEGFTITGSIISDNNIGIDFAQFNDDFAPVMDSRICNNVEYNIRNNSQVNIDMYTNCWCTDDQDTIEESIFDGDDDNEVGLVSYDIFDTTCIEIISTINKTDPDIFIWTMANSPYQIANDYVLFPNKTLIIEPGVSVLVAPQAKFEIRGSLLVQGTEADSVYFGPLFGNEKGSWIGIEILNTLGGNANIRYAKFMHAETAIMEECCWGGNVYINHSSFVNNVIGLGGFSGDTTTVDSSYFAFNSRGVTQADKNISHTVFENNDYGLFATERIDVSNSIFTNHTEVALYGGRGVIDECEIVNNKMGVKGFFEGFEVRNSIVNENEIGIELSEFDDFISAVEDNRICFNREYNVYNSSDNNASLITNCWCDSDSTRVENLLFDGWDDTVAGLLDYTLFTNDCARAIFETDKENGIIIYFTTSNTSVQDENNGIKIS